MTIGAQSVSAIMPKRIALTSGESSAYTDPFQPAGSPDISVAAELTPALLESDLSWTRSTGGGSSMTAPLWHVVSHLFNHQTHHRGQLTTLLSQLGRDPGPTDFILLAFTEEDRQR